MSGFNLSFTPPGPVSSAFYKDEHPVMGFMGPVGGGKTTTCLMKLLQIASRQPVGHDGERRSRMGVFRDTYRNLANTVLKSWHGRVPSTMGTYRSGGQNAPTVHHLRFRVNDGSIVDTEFVFAAVGDNNVEAFCRGFELTAGYLNEADLQPDDFLIHLPGRLRYPGKDAGGIRWRGLLLDFNAPDTDSFLYDRFVENPRDGYKLYVQPSGLSAEAENVANLPDNYYADIMRGQPDWWVRRFIHNQWGFSRSGQPVYTDFSDQRHVSQTEFGPIKGLPIILGADGGLTLNPAAALMQLSSIGQLRVFDEVVCPDATAAQFAQAVNERLAFWGLTLGWEIFGEADPASEVRSSTDGLSWLDVVDARTKIKWQTAPTNDPSIRQEAVRSFLTRTVDGGQPGFLLSPRCKVTRKGFNSDYRYAKRKDGQRSDKPDKNHPYSDVHDGLQYGAIRAGGGVSALIHGDRATKAFERMLRQHEQGEYDPFSF